MTRTGLNQWAPTGEVLAAQLWIVLDWVFLLPFLFISFFTQYLLAYSLFCYLTVLSL